VAPRTVRLRRALIDPSIERGGPASRPSCLGSDRRGQAMRFADCWKAAASDPGWLYFDSREAEYPELPRINGRGIYFVTIGRRGAAPLRRLGHQPASAREAAVVDVPKRCHQRIRYLAEEVHLRGYEGPIRQVAAGGSGREVRLKVDLDAALTAIADGW